MGLVWQYGEVSGNKSWKGLSWGMRNPGVNGFLGNITLGMNIGTNIMIEVLNFVGLSCFTIGVPLLGGAFCACMWHFFYNSESLQVLVALQAALTVLGNVTMCLAAFRIYRSSEECSKNM